MSNWMLKLHLYGGLLCFWYLIIFGVSSLFYQHHFAFMENKGESQGVERRTIALSNLPEDADMALQIMDSLDMAGWHLFWLTKRDSLGVFHTQVENPKMTYKIQYDPSTTEISIEGSYKGLWHVINSLHAMGKIPGAPLMILWKIYTYICVVVVLFSIFSGIWLWAKKGDKIGWSVFSIVLAGSLFLMFYIYYYG